MKKDIHHIHDKTYRSFFENKEIFLELLQNFVKETWTAATSFKDKTQRADMFGEYVIDFKYILINVNDYSKQDLVAIQNTVSAVFLLDQKIDSIEFIKRAALVATEFKSLSEEHKLKLKDWLDHIIEEPIRQVVLDLLESSEEEVNKMTANITKTLQEEKAQAIGQGEKKKALEVAKKMLGKGMNLEEIIEITGLSKVDIEDLE